MHTAHERDIDRPEGLETVWSRNGMVTRIRIDKKEVEAFCQRWKIAELSVFGSVLRDDFRPDSDVDVLVRFEPSARYGLFAVARMQEELQVILGRPVDLVVRSEIERSRNYIRRKEILGSLEPIYAT